MAKITSRRAPQHKHTRRPRTANKSPKVVAFVASHNASVRFQSISFSPLMRPHSSQPKESSSSGPLASSSTDQLAGPKSSAQNKQIVRVYHKENATRMTRHAVRQSGDPLASFCLYCNAHVLENVRSSAHLAGCPFQEKPVKVTVKRQAQLRPILYCK
ncbi:hypothetical protein CPB85DRAFT_1294344 [Mucidula mucida]|nr:hypothetical protein CPB85DRAFT_1294344 [Mucidula mucida]